MNPADTTNYGLLKAAVLKKYEINRETYRQRFRSYDTPAEESPQELYTRLKDSFCKWVQYDTCSKEEMMEKMVLEQYLKMLYPEAKAWVKERDPTTAAMAAKLVDAYVSAHKGPGFYRYAGQRRLQGGGASGIKEGGRGPWREQLGPGSAHVLEPNSQG
ncbi:zinc finger protein 446-like [Micropterus salmoides]|uniref:zinc finger protein 446-like n=1 Tax=Micropterus salmoides TaxID=27706 RepID=UPI0018EB3F47|nr:zinc finger protein 446-like [Micropterus salmoides]